MCVCVFVCACVRMCVMFVHTYTRATQRTYCDTYNVCVGAYLCARELVWPGFDQNVRTMTRTQEGFIKRTYFDDIETKDKPLLFWGLGLDGSNVSTNMASFSNRELLPFPVVDIGGDPRKGQNDIQLLGVKSLLSNQGAPRQYSQIGDKEMPQHGKGARSNKSKPRRKLPTGIFLQLLVHEIKTMEKIGKQIFLVQNRCDSVGFMSAAGAPAPTGKHLFCINCDACGITLPHCKPRAKTDRGEGKETGKRTRSGNAKMQGEDEAKVNQPRSDTGMEDEAPAGEELRPRRLAAAAVAAAAADAAEEEGEGEDEDEEYHDAQDDEGDDSNDEYYDVKEVEDSEDDEDEERSRDDESSRLCGVPEVLRRQEERNLRDGDGNNKVLHYDGICHAAMTSKVRKDFATAFEGNPKISVYGSQKPAEPMTAEKAEKSFAEYQTKNSTGKYKWLSK